MKKIIYIISLIFILSSCSWDNTVTENNLENNSVEKNTEISQEIKNYEKFDFTTQSWSLVSIYPVDHATAAINWWEDLIYVDPANDIEWFSNPNFVFITHEHGDHFNQETLKKIVNEETNFITTQEVYSKLDEELQEFATVMQNGEIMTIQWLTITAVAAYNIREEALKYHPKGQWNGYIFEKDWLRVYFSWDTEDTPEMRALKDIDVAFVSMNLPYTMPVDSAADGVLEFAPKNIFPYHYRGKEEISDINKFKSIVESQNSEINVLFADWYWE